MSGRPIRILGTAGSRRRERRQRMGRQARRVPLSTAAEAQAAAEKGGVGKILLVP